MTTQKAVYRALPENAKAYTHTFTIGGHEGMITVSMYEDGTPGQILIWTLKEGATSQGLLNGACMALSVALQYGVPITAILTQFKGLSFQPAGWTKHSAIPMAKSILDYLAQWLEYGFPPCHDCGAAMVRSETQIHCPSCGSQSTTAEVVTTEVPQLASQEVRRGPINDAPPCHECGSAMVREDNGYRCENCGATAGLG